MKKYKLLQQGMDFLTSNKEENWQTQKLILK